MKIVNSLIVIFGMLLFVGSSLADAGKYNCKINQVYDLSDNATLKASGWQKTFKGNKFIVSKQTGAIEGETLTTVLADKTKVINSGSNENSFKAVAFFKEQVQIIEIQQFKQGANKPFVAMSTMGGAGIVTGVYQ
jgi:hypothetical protein